MRIIQLIQYIRSLERSRVVGLLICLVGIPALVIPSHAGRTFVDGQLLQVTSAVVSVEPFTICGWVRPSVLATAMGIAGIATSGSTNHYHSLYLETNNQFVIRSRDAAVLASTGVAGQAVQNVWTHVCGVWTSTTSRTLYVNGSANTSTDATSVTATGMNRSWIGKYLDVVGNLEWNGDLAEFAIWNVAVTAAEVQTLFNKTPPCQVRTLALVSYVPLSGVHDPELDWRGPRAWTLINAPTAAGTHAPVPPCRR